MSWNQPFGRIRTSGPTHCDVRRPDLYLVVHLLRAVEDVHHDPDCPAQVLGGLCLSCASRACRGSSHDQVEGLGQGDIASAKHRAIGGIIVALENARRARLTVIKLGYEGLIPVSEWGDH